MSALRPRRVGVCLLAAWALLALLAHKLPVGGAPGRAEAEQFVHYRLQAKLHPRVRLLEGQGTLAWRNPSPTTAVHELWLHLYLNAFRDDRSTFMDESGGRHRGHAFDASSPGGMELKSFRRVGGPDLAPGAAFDTDACGNPNDGTVLRVPLDEPIPPGGEATFEMSWTSLLPRIFARTGAALGETFFLVAQWYPKPGMFEETVLEDGTSMWAWNCHAFHGASEFYAPYGTFDVTLDVPEVFDGKVGASGRRVGETVVAEPGRIRVRHVAENVHDFAWTCGEDFVVESFRFAGRGGPFTDEARRVARILGVEEGTLHLQPVDVHMFLQPEHRDQAERHRVAVENALGLFGLWFGPYPYPTLTVVDPDHRGRDAGGMEYPTLVTAGTRLHPQIAPYGPEGVLVHEIGHQWFYGLVGTNEFEHAWMDEGFTTYATAKALDHAWPRGPRATAYAGVPLVRGERPLPFEGILAESRRVWSPPADLLDDSLRLPFGAWEPIRRLAAAMGSNHPPDQISLWPNTGSVEPLDLLREQPWIGFLDLLPGTTAEYERLADASREVVDPIAGRAAWEYRDRASYGVNSYVRTANALRTLERMLGEENMVRLLRRYVDRWRYRHPKPADFFTVAEELAAEIGHEPLQPFFEDVFLEGRDVDYGIDAIEVKRIEPLKGATPVAPSAPSVPAASSASDGPTPPAPVVRSDVVLRRRGEAIMPVVVHVRFEDGTVRVLRWGRDDVVESLDGGERPLVVVPPRARQSRWVRMRFVGPHAVTLAHVDPHGVLALERNRLDNGRRDERHAATGVLLTLRLLGRVEMLASYYGGL